MSFQNDIYLWTGGCSSHGARLVSNWHFSWYFSFPQSLYDAEPVPLANDVMPSPSKESSDTIFRWVYSLWSLEGSNTHLRASDCLSCRMSRGRNLQVTFPCSSNAFWRQQSNLVVCLLRWNINYLMCITKTSQRTKTKAVKNRVRVGCV